MVAIRQVETRHSRYGIGYYSSYCMLHTNCIDAQLYLHVLFTHYMLMHIFFMHVHIHKFIQIHTHTQLPTCKHTDTPTKCANTSETQYFLGHIISTQLFTPSKNEQVHDSEISYIAKIVYLIPSLYVNTSWIIYEWCNLIRGQFLPLIN